MSSESVLRGMNTHAEPDGRTSDSGEKRRFSDTEDVQSHFGWLFVRLLGGWVYC